MLAAMAGNEGRERHPTAAAAAWGLWGLGTVAFRSPPGWAGCTAGSAGATWSS